MKSGFLDKLIERIDRLDPGSLQAQFLRLAREKGFLETIFHAIREGIVVLDEPGRIVYANRAAGRLLGMDPEKATGQPLQRYLRDIEWHRVLRLDEREWTRLVNREIEVTYPEHRFLDLYLVPLALENNGGHGAVIILRDVTREREHAVETIESEKLNALTLLAAGVAHEIGNPLNSLNIHLQLMEREMAGLPEEKRAALGELLAVARGEITRLDQIIGQFLRAIRPTQPNFERAALPELLDETLEVVGAEIRNRDVLVEVDRPDELPPALVDRGQIKQAFFNIIRNAIQAMSGGGLLKITFSANDRFVVAAFADTGPGIHPDVLSDLFEPYQTTKAEGSGLGLMIVQRIVREHGGELEIHSKPEAGATFVLYLPREDQRIRLLKAHRGPREAAPEEAP